MDDIRSPDDEYNWIIVRNVYDAVHIIQTSGIPEYMSLDHDLGDNVPTGYDFVKYLVDYAMNNNIKLNIKNIEVHSMNPIGKQNMIGLLQSYDKFYNLINSK